MNIRIFSFLLLLVVSVSLSACATRQNYTLMLDGWTGASEETLLRAWGVPDKVYELDTSKKMIAYKRSRIMSNTTPTNCAPMFGGIDCIGGHTKLYQQSCETTFVLEKRIVKSWNIKGNDCRL